MRRGGRILLTVVAATAAFASGVAAQEAVEAREEADRATVRAVLDRDDVRAVARIAGADVDGALEAVEGLEGEPLARAAHQATTLERRLDAAAQDGISLSVTAIIIILIIVLIIIVAV